MRTDPGVINLGVVTLGPVGAPQPPAPQPAPAGPWHRVRRWWPLAALALVLVASTSAAAPVTTGLAPQFQLPAGQVSAVVIAGQTLFVATGRGPRVTEPDPEWTISAYRLTDGLRLWSVDHEVSARQPFIEVQTSAGAPLVTVWSYRLEATGRPPVIVAGETSAYDPGTGELRWRHPGFVAGLPDGRMVVLELVEREGTPLGPSAYHVATVDLVTGERRSGHELSMASGPDDRRPVWTTSEDGRYLATLDRDGLMTVRDLRAGAAKTSNIGQFWYDASLAIDSDGQLRVSVLWDRKRTLAMYGLDPPTRQWTLAGQSATARLHTCGPVWCLRTQDELQGLDPGTGAARWRLPGRWQDPAVLAPPWPAAHLHLTDAGQHLVVDAASGRTVLDLGPWQPFGPADQLATPLVQQREPGAHQPGHPDFDPGRLWLGRVAADLAGVSVLGWLDGARSCHAAGQHLACVTTDQLIEVFRFAR